MKRDIYYTLRPGEPDQISLDDLPLAGPRGLFDLLADPGRYASLDHLQATTIHSDPGAT